MAGSEPGWDEFIYRLARLLLRGLRAQLMPERYRVRLRELGALSEKLVYQHLMYNQPQTFTHLCRELGVGNRTVARALGRLKARGAVEQDGHFQYWVTEPEVRKEFTLREG